MSWGGHCTGLSLADDFRTPDLRAGAAAAIGRLHHRARPFRLRSHRCRCGCAAEAAADLDRRPARRCAGPRPDPEPAAPDRRRRSCARAGGATCRLLQRKAHERRLRKTLRPLSRLVATEAAARRHAAMNPTEISEWPGATAPSVPNGNSR